VGLLILYNASQVQLNVLDPDLVTVYPSTVTGTPTPTANPGGPVVNFDPIYNANNTYLNNLSSLLTTGLNNTLDITNLDVENPGVNGGPLPDITTVYPALVTGTPTTIANPGGAPQRFIQPYKPGNTYLDANPIQGVGSGKLDDTLPITNLDVEDPGVNGGPLNDTTTSYPASVTGTPTTIANPGGAPKQFTQVYLPSNTYLDASYKVSPNNTVLNNILNITNLDVEDPGVNGGIPYKSLNDPTIYPTNTNHTSPIRGYFAAPSSASLKFEQIFNPKNTYSDFINPYTL